MMPPKRIVELSFLALFALGVGISLFIHQSFDQWLTQLVQASGSKVAGGPLKLVDLKWQAAEQTLSMAGGQWFDSEQAREPWLVLPAARWTLSADAWQGARFHAERFTLAGLSVRLQQEGLTTNLNRLIQHLDTVDITPEKVGRGKEPLVFTLEKVVFKDVQVELRTLKHGVLRWTITELILPQTTAEQPFDRLLQQVTRDLLQELKLQSTEQLLSLAKPTPDPAPSADSHE